MQAWWRRTFREPLHRLWLESAVLSGAVPEVAKERYILDRARYEAAIFKFRDWSWVDPTKEITAYKEAVKAGFTTVGDVIAATSGGLDFEDVMTARQRELEVMEDKGLYFDTEVEEPPEPAEPEPTNPPPGEDDDEGAAAARAHLRAVRGAP
jgi:capsid protein